ncbi:MAG TPA: hypothetical protein VF177_11075 [Anaerolineae bacterium]
MQKRFVFVLTIIILLLVACGGAPEPAVEEGVVDDTAGVAVSESTDESMEESTDESVSESESEETGEGEAGSAENVEESVEESADQSDEASTNGATGENDEATGDTVANRPASGVDPETGLEINPETFGPGDEFLVRGTIISMNLTPVVSPEFLIEAPSGRRYRLGSQSLAETFYDDGTQIQPHEYRQGMLAEATVTLSPDAGPSDILRSENLTLLGDE